MVVMTMAWTDLVPLPFNDMSSKLGSTWVLQSTATLLH